MTEDRTAGNELVRARRKLVAIERAKFRLQQRLEAIDYELDVLKPQIEELERQALQGELPEFGRVKELKK